MYVGDGRTLKVIVNGRIVLYVRVVVYMRVVVYVRVDEASYRGS